MSPSSVLAANFPGVDFDLEVPKLSGDELNQQLTSGVIPQVLREQWQLVDENSDLGAEFQSYMSGLTSSLLNDAGVQLKAMQPGIRFFLTNEEQANAGVVTSAVPPVIVVTKGLWKLLQTRDQHEAVTAHECGHEKIYELIGKHNNSKGEETGADLFAVDVLDRAKRNVEASKEVIQLFQSQRPNDDSGPESWGNYIDPHPNDFLRVRVLENAYDAIRESKGGYTTKSEPVDPVLKARFSEFSYKTPFQTLLENEGFNNLSLEAQVDKLCEWVSYSKKWRDAGYKLRADELSTLVSTTMRSLRNSLIHKDGAEEYVRKTELAERLAQAVLFSGNKELYLYAVGRETNWPMLVAGLSQHIQAFIDSDSPSKTWAEALSILAITDKFDLKNNAVLPSLNFPHYIAENAKAVPEAEDNIMREFNERYSEGMDPAALYDELCEKHGVKVPWETQFLHFQQSQSPEILSVLRLLGAKDPRFSRLPEDPNAVPSYSRWSEQDCWTSKEDEAHPVISQLVMKEGSGSIYSYETANYIRHAKFNSQGRMIAPSCRERQHESRFKNITDYDDRFNKEKYNIDAATNFERRRLILVGHAQDLKLATTDFSAMGADFWGFVQEHRKELTPEHSFLDGSQPFQERFVEELSHLVETQPEKFRPLAYEFFAGKDSTTGERIFVREGERRVTLPGLLDTKIVEDDQYASKTYADLSYGVSLNHPFISFVTHDPCHLFSSNAEKIPVLDYGRWQIKAKPAPEDKPEDVFDKNVYQLFVPDTHPTWAATKEFISGFAKWMQDAKAFEEEKRAKDLGYLEPADLLFSYTDREPFSFIRYQLHETVVCNYLLHSDDALNYEDSRFLLGYLKEESGTFRNIIDEGRTKQIVRNSRIDLSSDISAEELFQKYNLYMDFNVLDNLPELRRQYQTKLIERGGEIAPEKLSALIEHTLSKHKRMNPAFKEWAFGAWADAQHTMFNATPNADLDACLKQTTERICEIMPIEVAQPMLARFAETFRLQRDHAYLVEDRLSDKGLKELGKRNIAAIFGEVLIDAVAKKPKVRQQLIEYLSTAETKDSTKTMVGVLRDEITDFFKDEKINPGRIELSQESQEDIIRLMHENYSAWPLEWQALYLEKVLFPVNEHHLKDSGQNITIESEAKIIFDKAFPPDESNSSLLREYIECHLAELPPSSQRLYLAIIMASGKEREKDLGDPVSELRETGRTLARIMGRMHPLGAKFVQEIESYPGTDPEIREGIRDIDVKSGIDIGTRWSMWHLIDDATAEAPHVLAGKTVEQVLGGGSVQLNVALKKDEIVGGEIESEMEAMALLRPYVNERAERQYRVFHSALTKFTQNRPEFSELLGILDSSYRNLKIETDYNLAAKQAGNSQKIYKDTSIVADDIAVHFSAVDFKENGKTYKVYSMADGLHFNDLPAGMEEEIHIKRAIAKAIITRELTALLRGEAVDSDRHGKQQKIVVVHEEDGIHAYVVNFDDGAMAVNPPSLEERRVLGEILGKTLSLSLVQGVPINDAILQVTKNYKGSAHEHYIETCKRGLRTVFGDYINASFTNEQGNRASIVSNDDVRDIFAAILRDAHIDPFILYPAAREIGYEGFATIRGRGLLRSAKDLTQTISGGSRGAFETARYGVQKLVRASSVRIDDSASHIERWYHDRTQDMSLSQRFNFSAKNIAGAIVTKIASRIAQGDHEVVYARD